MKFVRYTADSAVRQGVLLDSEIKEISGNLFSEWEYTGRVLNVSEVQLLAPLVPNQIIGIGANFVADQGDLPEVLPDIPVFFFKPVSSVIGPDEKIVIPTGTEEVKFESELAVVIGKEAKNLSEDEVLDHVFGYTVGNDVTAPAFSTETDTGRSGNRLILLHLLALSLKRSWIRLQ